jgi:uncharacterized iron-regulated protein
MRLALAAAVLLTFADASWAKDPVYRLSIGDPARKDKDAAVTLDAITDTATGETIAPAALGARLAKARLVLVGESHTSVESHRVEVQVIKALADAGRHVTIALEMFPYPSQPALDEWNRGAESEADFVAASHWYDAWGYHWGYYRDVFLLARAHRFPVVAVNAPREVVTAVRQKGLASLPADQSAHFPPAIDVSSADHLAFFKASFDEGDAMHGGMTDAAWTAMLSAQATWDGTMAWNAVKELERHGDDPGATVVVLVGSGHVAYGLGIERQARTYFAGPIASVIAMPIADDKGVPIPAVRASYANFIWGVAREADSYWPALGASTRATENGRRAIIDVEKDTPAAAAGLQVGDVIVSIDGTAIDNRETLNRVLAGYQWGDTPTVIVSRGGADVPVTVPLRRRP